jgi:hypothetical protein
MRPAQVSPAARRETAAAFRRLDYPALADIYCDEGGEAFWRAMREPCRRLGLRIASALRGRLRRDGRSLYVGAGVTEIPAVVMERLDLGREVLACNLRKKEASLLRRACGPASSCFRAQDAGRAPGRFDHLWLVSVLNDPEEFPELSALSYGRADPTRFRSSAFESQRRKVRRLAAACLGKLSLPAFVTTSIEEVVWVEEWCARRGVACRMEKKTYPTAIVGDPVCFIRLGS